MKIVILHSAIDLNDRIDEYDALVQADAIFNALISLGHNPIKLALSFDLQGCISTIKKFKPNIVFNIVETIAGKGSLIHFGTTLLDLINIPYTGSKNDAMFLTSNKLIAKKILSLSKIPTPDWYDLDILKAKNIFLQDHYILKPVWEHASIGLDENSIKVVSTSVQLLKELKSHQSKLGLDTYAEVFIDGREFNISLLAWENGVQILPSAEIIFNGFPEDRPRIVGYEAKWNTESFEYRNTRRSFDFTEKDGTVLKQLGDIAVRCWDLFKLRGYARVDFRVDKNLRPWVLEINANPCISPDSGFIAASQKAGLTYIDVVQRILNDIPNPF